MTELNLNRWRIRMKIQWRSVVVLSVVIIGIGLGRAQMRMDKPVIRLDPALDALISIDAKVEEVKTGFGFTEGINWVEEGKNGFLIFSDIPANVINKMTPDGKVSVFVDRSGFHGRFDGYTMLTEGKESTNGKDPKDPLFRKFVMIGSNGLTLDMQGRLIICTYAGRSVERLEKNGERTLLADRYEGKRFSGPNDVVVGKRGAIYFSDTMIGLRGQEKDPSREMPFEGIFMIKNGKVTLAVNDIPTPNGMAFSPDETYFYANERGTQLVRRYDVQSDDTLTNSKLLIDMGAQDKSPGNADGMRVDAKGNIYTAGPRGIWILSPEGKHLGTIVTPELVGNLTFGDPDYKTLYIAARTTIYKIRVNTPGNRRLPQLVE